MKLFLVIILLFLNNCSFDDKTGIWKNEKALTKKESSLFTDFKTLTGSKSVFNEIIRLEENFNFELPKRVNNDKWEDIYYNQFNNSENFNYNGQKNLLFKSKKISKHNLNSSLLFDKKNLILADEKGNLIFFSDKENKIIHKFNFYKKKFKRIKKKINYVLDNTTIFVTDNLGFIYAYDYEQKRILWAKNNKVPFRSNLKIKDSKLIAADQNNNILLFNKKDGKVLKLIPTEDSKINNSFRNNFSLNENSIFMLNTYGSLYAIDDKTNNVKWVVNLNQSLDINPNNLFNGNVLVNNNDIIVVTSHESTFIINSSNGSILKKFNIVSQIKPLIINKYIFLISTNNLLISINIQNGEIVYSYNLNQIIANYYNIGEKTAFFKSIMIANDRILILTQNSYLLELELEGNLKNIFKLSKKVKSNFIFLKNSILYLSYKKRIIILG